MVLFSDQILTWELNRGVVTHKITPKSSSQSFHDACAAPAQDMIYALATSSDSSKVQVQQFNATSGKIVRVVKAGKGGGASGLGLINNNECLVVRQEDQVRILRLADGKKVAKCSSLNETNAGDQNIAACETMVATISQGQIVLINGQNGKKTTSIPLDKAATASAWTSYDLWKQNDNNLILLEGEKIHQISASSGSVLRTWNCPMDGSLEGQYRVGFGSSILALLHKNGKYQVATERLNEKGDGDEITVAWMSTDEKLKSDGSTKQSQKRKQSGAAESAVLGPGQTGGEAPISDGPASKRSKVEELLEDDEGEDDDDGEGGEGPKIPTVGERLQLLREALDEEDRRAEEEEEENRRDAISKAEAHGISFLPKQATTESLGKLLEQGLAAGEEALIELALAVRDEEILKETCEELSDELLPGLLNALTARMAGKGNRFGHLHIWVSALLKTGRMRSLAHLQPLKNLIEERLEVFPDLLLLEGRLSRMAEKMPRAATNR